MPGWPDDDPAWGPLGAMIVLGALFAIACGLAVVSVLGLGGWL